jgi:hypothetical protein
MALAQLVVTGLMTVVALGQGLDSMSRKQPAPDKLKAYEKLFTPPQKQDQPFTFRFPQGASTNRPDQQPRVVCGMVTVPVTPDLDPKMVVARKGDAKIDAKIRMIEPQICNK